MPYSDARKCTSTGLSSAAGPRSTSKSSPAAPRGRSVAGPQQHRGGRRAGGVGRAPGGHADGEPAGRDAALLGELGGLGADRAGPPTAVGQRPGFADQRGQPGRTPGQQHRQAAGVGVGQVEGADREVAVPEQRVAPAEVDQLARPGVDGVPHPLLAGGGWCVLGLGFGHRSTLTGALSAGPPAPRPEGLAVPGNGRDMVDGVHRAGGASGAHRRVTACDTIRCSVKQIAERVPGFVVGTHEVDGFGPALRRISRSEPQTLRHPNGASVAARTAPGAAYKSPCRGESTT